MKRLLFVFPAMLIMCVTGLPASVQAQQNLSVQQIRQHQVLGIPTSYCGHVIELMNSNRHRQQMGMMPEQLHLPHLTVGLNPGDLKMLSIQQKTAAGVDCGPTYEMVLENCSNVPIGNFTVSLVAVLGQIDCHSPTTEICIDRMEPHEQKVICLTMPMTAMTMGPYNQPCRFDTLVVALDSHDMLLECDELNNIFVLKMAEIPVIEVTTTVAPETQPQQDPAVQQPAQPPVQVPGQNPEPSPNQQIDLDNLEIDEARNLLMQF